MCLYSSLSYMTLLSENKYSENLQLSLGLQFGDRMCLPGFYKTVDSIPSISHDTDR